MRTVLCLAWLLSSVFVIALVSNMSFGTPVRNATMFTSGFAGVVSIIFCLRVWTKGKIFD